MTSYEKSVKNSSTHARIGESSVYKRHMRKSTGIAGALGKSIVTLLTNAIKYAPSVQPIKVRAVRNDDWVTISVQDQGKGIPHDQQASIFGRFYRVNDPKQKRPPGTGLGLYLVAEIIKRQGGRIWVESIPGGLLLRDWPGYHPGNRLNLILQLERKNMRADRGRRTAGCFSLVTSEGLIPQCLQAHMLSLIPDSGH